MLLDDLKDRIHPPDWLPRNTMYLTQMGSVAYGVSGDASDCDYYGFAIPPKDQVFTHLRGEIIGFGTQIERFNQWQQHGIRNKEGTKTYDFSVYNIVRFFQLCMENNPNMVDALFVPHNCIVHCTHVGNMVRDNRHIFLHKGCWHRFKNYAFSQLHKLDRSPVGKRKAGVEKHGFDLKFAYHIVRLMNEVEQILAEGNLDLQRSKEELKSIRRGDWTEERIRSWFETKSIQLEKLFGESKLPMLPDETEIKKLLLRCLEHHYGGLDKECIVNPDDAVSDIRRIKAILERWE